jgi:hypothetical protein
LIKSVLLASADHDLRAFAGEDLRNGFADAPAGSGNDGHFVFENPHEFQSLSLEIRFRQLPGVPLAGAGDYIQIE